MGWMEILALLKRTAPLLGRLVPLLETFLATKAGTRNEAATTLELLAGDMRNQLHTANGKQADLAEALTAQAGQLAALSENLSQLRRLEGRNADAIEEVQKALAGLQAALRRVTMAVIALLLTTVALLLVLVLRHAG